ncbi:MAG: HRDC domain-containing protein [Planctomycetota bacterium]
MRVAFFSISARDPEAETARLNAFLNANRVLDVHRELVSEGQRSFWAVCVQYVVDQAAVSGSAPKRARVDYREILDISTFAIFSELRELRKRRADEEGVPVYQIFTNEQLAAIARGDVTSVDGLGRVEGVGPSRLEKYGVTFIEAAAAARKSTGDSP